MLLNTKATKATSVMPRIISTSITDGSNHHALLMRIYFFIFLIHLDEPIIISTCRYLLSLMLHPRIWVLL